MQSVYLGHFLECRCLDGCSVSYENGEWVKNLHPEPQHQLHGNYKLHAIVPTEPE